MFEFTALIYFHCLKNLNKELNILSQLFEGVFGENGVRGPQIVAEELRIIHENTGIAQELFRYLATPCPGRI